MKGVIMAGGKGTRLRPLTCNVPKPMVPLIQKPVMQYSIELLKKYGITEIAVTVQYLSDVIKEYFGDGSEFGVKLHYFEETTPLGTAGSVKQAEEFLDEPFVVVSGDALTDFNLQSGINFHEGNDSLVTIFMKQVECPLEFGVIMTDEQDQIVRFLEKPSWSEVFSDTVNTGIYIMNPEIFSYIKEDSVVDFSKDVFPKFLEDQSPLYGYSAEGYWSDIGNLKQYRQAQSDLLSGELNASIYGTEVQPNVWIGENVIIEEGVKIEGPVSIGANSVIRSGAHLGEHAVVGSGSTVSNKASIKRSVLWDGTYIGDESELRGATICQGVTVGTRATIFEDAVIGHHTVIGGAATIQPEVKVWPYKRVEEATTVPQAFVWNEVGAKSLLKGHRATGVANIEMTPEEATKFGAAYGTLLNQGSQVLVASDGHSFSQVMKLSLIQSLQASGVDVVELGQTMLPVLRFSVEHSESKGGIYIRLVDKNQEKQLVIEFYNEDGLPVSSSEQRELEQVITFQTYRRVAFEYVGQYEVNHQLEQNYVTNLMEHIHVKNIKARNLHVVVHEEGSSKLPLFTTMLEQLGCSIHHLDDHVDVARMREALLEFNADFGILIGESGEFISLMTEQGHLVSEEEQLLLFIYMQLEKGIRQELAVPLYGGSALEEVAASYDKTLIRTKTSARAMMETEGTVQMMSYDGPYAIVQLLDHVVESEKTLSEVLNALPVQSIYKQEVTCKTQQKGIVMRKLLESLKGKNVELIDGMKVKHTEESWTFIVPDQEKGTFTVYAQSTDGAHAKQLAGEYIEQINFIKQQTS
ncbi:sugar phosphate nucleotidyltransferase [Halalkalibacter okhensis]|uniref:Nucleoside-diphosphate-sugar pyrophosphorylase n=1 Tax=Halalkalibacter okhensis TaxID=333138 RepID=A0A0B0IQB0_9BACI|nr:sugar phosphate nucleotidyltransferase [Halalkalibacter okhensis]KHF41836.1 nucleoside-diphosphate-sugar pyrophosphorylase [Halalkalibacter okhensis]